MHTLQHSYKTHYFPVTARQSLFVKFFSWCKTQEQYRFGWLAAILTIHGCVFAPLTLFMIFLGGNSFVFWGMTIAAFAMALVSNLAAMPTKITIPVFFLSVLIDVVIVVLCFLNFLQR